MTADHSDRKTWLSLLNDMYGVMDAQVKIIHSKRVEKMKTTLKTSGED
jgi:hypothetical protein